MLLVNKGLSSTPREKLGMVVTLFTKSVRSRFRECGEEMLFQKNIGWKMTEKDNSINP